MAVNNQKLGQILRKLREEKGLTQEEVANALDIPRPSVSQIESNQRDITLAEFQKLSQLFQASFDEIMSEMAEKKPGSGNPAKSTANPNKKIKFNAEKFRHLLLYILEKCGSKPNVGETVLYKLLYFCDFDYFELYEKPLTGMIYRKLQFGPVPKQTLYNTIIKEMVDEKQIAIINIPYKDNYVQRRYVNFLSPNLTFFNLEEIELVNRVINRLSDMSARQIEDHVHGDYPWASHELNEDISYDSVFYRSGEFAQRDYDELWQQAAANDILKELGKMSEEENEYYLELLNKND